MHSYGFSLFFWLFGFIFLQASVGGSIVTQIKKENYLYMSKVLITGGTRGIGLEIAKKFIVNGDNVYIAARNTECELIDGEKVHLIKCDLSNKYDVQNLYERVSGIDILINNAGIMPGEPYYNYNDEIRNYILQLNLFTPVDISVYYGEQMAQNGGGRIVNIASQAGLVGNPDIWYGMTKAALVNFTKSMAGHLGKNNVVINAVSPGPVDTEMISGSPYNKRFEKIRKRTCLERFAYPEEVAQAVFFLAKQSPVYYNGENMILNNGALSLEMT